MIMPQDAGQRKLHGSKDVQNHGIAGDCRVDAFHLGRTGRSIRSPLRRPLDLFSAPASGQAKSRVHLPSAFNMLHLKQHQY